MTTQFVSMRLTGLSELRKSLGKLQRDFPSTVAQALRTSARHVVIPATRANIKKNRSVFTGEYHSRQDAKSGVGSGGPWVEIGAIGVPYGINVESGAPPHTPDEGRIREYVKKKMGFQGTKADAVTAKIIHTIKTHGTRAHPALLPAWNANRRRFFEDVVRRVRQRAVKKRP